MLTKVEKEAFPDNPVHNIDKFYEDLVQCPFTTSKTKLENKYKKLCI